MKSVYFYTLTLSFFSTLLAVLVGLPAAFFCSRRKFPGGKILLAMGIVPLCVPALIVALANIGCFGVNGFLTRFLLGKTNLKTWLYSAAGIVIVQAFYNFPFITSVVTNAWKELPQDQENAAKLLGASDFRIFFTITLKRISGALAAACIPVFLFCFFSFMIVLLFSPPGHSVLEVELYHSVRTTLNLKSGAGFAVTETLTALFIVFIYSFISRKSQTSMDGIQFSLHKISRIGKTPYTTKKQQILEITGFILLSAIIIIFFVCPGISILVNSFTNKNRFSLYQYISLFKNSGFRKAFVNTLWIGCCTGFFCTLVGFSYSLLVKLTNKSGNLFFQTLPLLPMAVSSVVISWIFTMIFRKGSVPLLIFIQVLLYWPISYRQIQNGINRLGKDTVAATKIFSRNIFDSIWRIYIPSCKTVLLSSFGYCFAISAGDATMPLVLSIPRFNSLAFYTYRLANSYKFNQACASGVILAVLCAGVYLLSRSTKSSR